MRIAVYSNHLGLARTVSTVNLANFVLLVVVGRRMLLAATNTPVWEVTAVPAIVDMSSTNYLLILNQSRLLEAITVWILDRPLIIPMNVS